MIRGMFAMLDRALRVDSRLLRAHLVRLFFVAIVVWTLLNARSMSSILGAPGHQFFEGMLIFTFILITLGGLSIFPTAITEEKEEMTLGLLRMAGVGPAAILLGKGTSRLLIVLSILAVQFPFLLLSITLGGVLLHQVWAGYMALIAYMLLLANAGLLLSVIFPNSRKAAFWMTVILFLYFVAPWILRSVLMASTTAGTISLEGNTMLYAEWVLDLFDASNVFYRLDMMTSSNFTEPVVSFQVISNCVAALAFFLLSWFTFNFFNREETSASQERPWLPRRLGRRGLLRVPRAWPFALVWKDFYYLTGGLPMIMAKLCLYGFLSVGADAIYEYSNNFAVTLDQETLGDTFMWMGAIFFFIEMCFYCSRIYHEELRWKTFPGLYMLPGSFLLTVYSKWVGCLLGLIPAILYFVLGVFLAPGDFEYLWNEFWDEPWLFYILLQFS